MQLNFYDFVRDTIFLEPLERNVDLVVQLVGKAIFFKTKKVIYGQAKVHKNALGRSGPFEF